MYVRNSIFFLTISGIITYIKMFWNTMFFVWFQWFFSSFIWKFNCDSKTDMVIYLKWLIEPLKTNYLVCGLILMIFFLSHGNSIGIFKYVIVVYLKGLTEPQNCYVLKKLVRFVDYFCTQSIKTVFWYCCFFTLILHERDIYHIV